MSPRKKQHCNPLAVVCDNLRPIPSYIFFIISSPFRYTFLLNYFFFGLFVHFFVTADAVDNFCLVNPALGYDILTNVYECKPPLKCCTEFGKPSCCGSKPSWKIIQEQVTLWGGLFAILLAIASIVYCRKNDLNVPACVALKRGAIRLCCGGSAGVHSNEGENRGEEDSEMALKHHQRGEAGASHGWRNNTVNPLVIEMSHV